jgi:murein DD-endopeptidase / murein LD-carboxypeptidase
MGRRRTVFTILVFTFSLFPPGVAVPDAAAKEKKLATSSAESDSFRLDASLLHEEVTACLGVPYRRGGETTAGMDCSGFSKYMYSKLFGVQLPHKASQQYRMGLLRDISEEPLQMGDLVFFKEKNSISHVGIYLSDGNFVHSVSGKGVLISNLQSPYWKSVFAGSRRLAGLEEDARRNRARTYTFADVPFDESSDLRLRFSALLPDEQADFGLADDLSWMTFQGMPSDSAEDLPLSLEIAYQRYLTQDSVKIRLSAFWERSLREHAVTVFPSSFFWGTSHFKPRGQQTVFQSGWSLSGDIGLFQGVRISPFLTFFERAETMEDNGHSRSILGLEASVNPPASPYDLSMAVGYGDAAESALRSLNETGNLNDLTMSFRLRYWMKDLARISLGAQHGFGDPFDAQHGTLSTGKATSDLFLLFDFSY